MIEQIVTAVADAYGLSSEFTRKLVWTLLVLAVYVLARRIATGLVARNFEDVSTRYRFNKGAQLLLLMVGLGLVSRVWFQEATGLGTWLGLVSAGVAVALQDPVLDLAGWLYFVMRRPFTVGDRIQIGDIAGDVIDVHLFTFTLLEIGNWVEADQSTGRLIHIPNGWLFKQPIAGYDQGFAYIWNEIHVTVTFESDWRLAKTALQGVLEQLAEKIEQDEFHRSSEHHHVQFSRLTPVVWVSTAPEGVKLTMRYLCRPRARRVSTSHMWEAILDAFAALPDVDFAYPTQRRFDQAIEGKPALRAEGAPQRRREVRATLDEPSRPSGAEMGSDDDPR